MKVFIGDNLQAKVIIKSFYKKEIEIHNIFSGEKNQILAIPSIDNTSAHIVYIGLGEKDKLSLNDIRNISANALKKAKEFSNVEICFEVIDNCNFETKQIVVSMVEGMNLSEFKFLGYKSNNKDLKETEVYIKGINDRFNDDIKKALNLTDEMNKSKQLTLMPCNKLNPKIMADYIKNLENQYNFEVEILDSDTILKKGLNCLYSVSKGSNIKAKLAVIRYKPLNESGEVIALVGKGITCDTGGYCLKNRSSLPYIKGDMAGAGNMLATICALAKNECKVNAVAIIPLAENKISDDAYIPGDVITSYSQKTIEVIDTDCEGRMVLADAISFAIKDENATKIIDMATLTGLAGTTFGSLYTPIFCNDDNFYNKFMKSAKETDEDFWRMPLDDRYKGYLNSSVADISNMAGAGTITAAMFLKEFVEDKEWIHLDIAATAAQYPAVNDYAIDMPSGVAIRTIYNMLNNLYKE